MIFLINPIQYAVHHNGPCCSDLCVPEPSDSCCCDPMYNDCHCDGFDICPAWAM